MLDFLAEHRKYSVTYDKEMKAYFINGFPMAFCFVCGGSLPKYEPATVEEPMPLAEEEREALELVASCASFQEVLSVLGNPDYLQERDENSEEAEWRRVSKVLAERQPARFADSADTEWLRIAWFTKRWSSLCLQVYEYPDGRMWSSVIGLAPGQFVILPKRTWGKWFRQLCTR
jgi:hypothetical protein